MTAQLNLDITQLASAVERLRAGLVRYNLDTSDEMIRDGLIQRFEFTYEASHKYLKRFLKETAPSRDAIDRMSFADLIRTACEQGLPRGDWPAWRGYRDMRSRTSHAYDGVVAEEIIAGIPVFLEEATHLVEELQKRSSWGQ
jgi:nucleotidyltransferase substrate binding protein (TIGR01987 family)